MTPRRTAPAKATPARVRRPTAAELGATDLAEPRTPAAGFDPSVDFDMSAWQAEREQKSQEVEATRDALLFRIADRRPTDKKQAGPRLYEVEIPLLSKWRTKALRILESGSVTGIIDALVLATGDVELEEVLDELEGDEVGAIIEHLTEASGVGPGESRPSGASSRSTRRR